LSRQAIEALKELDFNISESMTNVEFIQIGKNYLLQPVMNWDQQGDKEKNKQTLEQNKHMFYNRLFNVGGKTYGLFRIAIHPPEKQSYEFMKYLDLLSLV
jgi:hypothetical protein